MGTVSGGGGYSARRIEHKREGIQLLTLSGLRMARQVLECLGFAYLRRKKSLNKIRCYFEFLSHTAISKFGILKENEAMTFIFTTSKCS